MSTETTEVETNIESASTQEKIEETSTQNTQEVDYEAELAKKDAEILRIAQEKENYRKGMLKAKGKLPEEDDTSSNDESQDSRMRRIVREEMLASKEAQAIAEKDTLVTSLAKKNKELALALKNRGQITTSSGQGSNQEKPGVKTDNVLSNEQIAHFKKKNWSDEKIAEFKKNLSRGVQEPK